MSNKDYRSTLILIKEAELVNGSNDFISNYYINSVKSSERIEVLDLDEETESKLLSKNDAFIDVILAQYCLFHKTVQKLFYKSISEKNLTLRLACLSNRSFGRTVWGVYSLPLALFENSNLDELKSWLATIDDEEIDTLFRNETTDDDFLTDFLSFDNGLWAILDEDKQRQVLRSLRRNPRIGKRYVGPMDGYAEYLHGKLFSVIWDLAKKLPVDKRWASVLGDLLENTYDGRYEFDSLEVAKRWHISEPEEKKKQYLSSFENVRFSIYKDIIKDIYRRDENNKIHYSNNDVAYRACAYVQTDMKEDDIKEAYKKDGLLAIEYIMRNLSVWRNENTRKVLHDIAWDAYSTFNDHHLACANMFNWKEEELSKKYPDWFLDKNEESEIDEDDKVLTVGLGRGLIQESIYHQSAEILSIKQAIDKSSKTVRWIFYGLVLLLLLEFTKR
jgi:hypothetical protein